MSKIGSFSENTVFYDTKLNHMVFDIFRGARALICLFPYGLTVICTKVWELSAGNFQVEKSMELGAQNAQLAGNAKMVQRICRVFEKLRESYQELRKSCKNPEALILNPHRKALELYTESDYSQEAQP